MSHEHRVIIIGGGFGGLRAARALKAAPVDVTLIGRRNFHLFQSLLYQVATGSLSPGEIAAPLRSVLRRQENTRVLLGEAVDIDPASKVVRLAGGARLLYDSLIVATGAPARSRGVAVRYARRTTAERVLVDAKAPDARFQRARRYAQRAAAPSAP